MPHPVSISFSKVLSVNQPNVILYDPHLMDETRFTVKQLADLDGVSRCTLHHYDAPGLLTPALVGENGYRHYDDGSLFRLQ